MISRIDQLFLKITKCFNVDVSIIVTIVAAAIVNNYKLLSVLF